MRLVVVESPFAGDIQKHTLYARAALADCINRGEAPIASHLLLPQILRDDDAREREIGIAAGLAWARRADVGVFYVDFGWSPGMRRALDFYHLWKIPTEIRQIAGWK